jgi:hypothetical protein
MIAALMHRLHRRGMKPTAYRMDCARCLRQFVEDQERLALARAQARSKQA